jgi:hypothetical protein
MVLMRAFVDRGCRVLYVFCTLIWTTVAIASGNGGNFSDPMFSQLSDEEKHLLEEYKVDYTALRNFYVNSTIHATLDIYDHTTGKSGNYAVPLPPSAPTKKREADDFV